MSDFDLLDQALENYNNETLKNSDPEESLCKHENIVNEKGVIVCIDCGEEIQQLISHEKEWRYYGQNDNKHTSNPNRVQMRRSEDRNIYADLSNLGLNQQIISYANKLYCDITDKKILRGKNRRRIIYGCVFFAHVNLGIKPNHERLSSLFGIDPKEGLKGLKDIKLENCMKYDSKKDLNIDCITPSNLVEDTMKKFSASKQQIQEVLEIYDSIKNRSSTLNRARPQSVASGVVFYWILVKGKDISIKDFADKVQLSELTINKMVKEIFTIKSSKKKSIES